MILGSPAPQVENHCRKSPGVTLLAFDSADVQWATGMNQATLIPIIADYIMVKTLFHKCSQLLAGILL